MHHNQAGEPMGAIADFIFLIFFIILLVAWLIVWAALHVAGGAVHLLLAIAVICLIVHFVRKA
jgi:hypothetical protein